MAAVERDPRSEYSKRLAAARSRAEAAARADARVANARLAVFLAALATAGITFLNAPGALGLTLVPLGLFAVLIVWHARILAAKARAQGIVAHYARALERVEGRWAGRGKTGEKLAPEDHLYARDLDLFGEGSLFELLCMARTPAGEATLASWLSQPASPDEIRRRQEAVEELRSNLDLREDLALLGDAARDAVRPPFAYAMDCRALYLSFPNGGSGVWS